MKFRQLFQDARPLVATLLGALAVFLTDSVSFASATDCADIHVALDIGHDTVSGGAVSARGVPEYQFNKKLVMTVRKALVDAGISTDVINESGKPIGLMDRVTQARDLGATVFISIHHDSVQEIYISKWEHNGRRLPYSDKYKGFSIFVSAKGGAYPASRELAFSLGRDLTSRGLTPSLHHSEDIDGERRPLLDASSGVYRYDGLAVLKHAKIPAILLEAGIIINRDEELVVSSDHFKASVASAIVGAVRGGCT